MGFDAPSSKAEIWTDASVKSNTHFRSPRFITNWKKLSQILLFRVPQSKSSFTVLTPWPSSPSQYLRAGSLGDGDSKTIFSAPSFV
jgi:hypothetical protein